MSPAAVGVSDKSERIDEAAQASTKAHGAWRLAMAEVYRAACGGSWDDVVVSEHIRRHLDALWRELENARAQLVELRSASANRA